MMSVRSALKRQVPLYAVVLAVALAAIAGAMIAYTTVTITTRTVTTIAGEVFVLTEELSVSDFGTSIATSDASATGTSAATAVVMTSTGAAANTAITKGDYVYSVKVVVAITQPTPDKVYKVTLKEDGTSKGDVYIKTGDTPAQGDSVTVSWDLGTSLASRVYEVDIVPA
jgi:hypothetical protein